MFSGFLDYTHSGALHDVQTGSNEKQYCILTNSTTFVTTVTLPNKNKQCLLIIHNTQNYVNLNCEGVNNTLELHQQLDVANGLKVFFNFKYFGLINNYYIIFRHPL